MNTQVARRERLWDAPVRITHWLLVLLLGFSWWSAENHEMEWHRYSGYAILTLLLFRIYWGFAGSGNARFGTFIRRPSVVGAYARNLFTGPARRWPGHNPLGGWSVLALLTALAVQISSGLFTVDEDGLESGPLSDRVDFDTGRLFAEVHEISFTILQILVVLHVLALLFYFFVKKDNLLWPMIVGRKPLSADDDWPTLSFAPHWRWMVGIVAALAIAYFVKSGLRL